ncbi:hypothetical protein GCM10007359_20160 [Rothia aerolata]|uniref:Fluoride-specific ion channel FluC n=1 Tax=Rothia aerolata TaxID=1812262 RepID=A0A917MV83_9MICC|nr:hypothetical protein GCM10007359_20160 [Rothia aerolata]
MRQMEWSLYYAPPVAPGSSSCLPCGRPLGTPGLTLCKARVYRRDVKEQKIPAGLLVFCGGGVGASLRWILGLLFPALPVTLVINVLGAFALGFLLTFLALSGPEDSSPSGARRRTVRLAVGTGFMGGFTTYSSFAVGSIELIQDDAWGGFFLYALASLCLGFVACFLGVWGAEKTASRQAFHVKRQPEKGGIR